MKTQHSQFRSWCIAIWKENCIERDSFKQPCFDMPEYFNRYKYWLKREYKFQTKNK